MIKILMLIPVWKRPEILRIFLWRMQAVVPDYATIQPLFILSPEDPNLKVIEKFTQDYYCLYYPNEYLGDKMNAGMTHAVNNFEFDYLMGMGSDNIYTGCMWELYREYFETWEQYFSINDFYVYDIVNERACYISKHVDEPALGGIGAGRVIHRSLIEDDPCIYKPRTCTGMDGFSAINLYRKGYKQKVIDTEGRPVMLDIKTNTNVNHSIELWPQRESDVEVSWIKDNFGLIDAQILDDGTFDLLNLNNFHCQVLKYSTEIRKEDAFNMVNIRYEITYGEPRFKNYDSYKSYMSKKR